MRRRRRTRSGGGLLERLASHPALGIRDLRALDGLPRLPEAVEIGQARGDGSQTLLLVVAREDRGDLVGWAKFASVAGSAADRGQEIWLVAPLIGRRTRRLAAASGLPIRLIALPSLAEATDDLIQMESVSESGMATATGGLLDRVSRVVDGAATMTAAGALRPSSEGPLLYLRGVPVIRLRESGESVMVYLLAPEKREFHITESSFPRWGVELHEKVVELSQDPRLVDADTAGREQAVERVSTRMGVPITARWVPLGVESADPIDWVGIDESQRPVVGIVRKAVEADAMGQLFTALIVLETERARWVPGSMGAAKLAVVAERVDEKIENWLRAAGVDFELRTEPFEGRELEDDQPRRDRPRRRPRRRRRGPGDESRNGAAADAPVETAADFADRAAPEQDEPAAVAVDVDAPSGDENQEPSDSPGNHNRPRPRSRSRRGRRRRPDREPIVVADETEDGFTVVGSDEFPDLDEPIVAQTDADESDDAPTDSRLEAEVEAAIIEAPEDDAPEVIDDDGVEDEVEVEESTRRRRARAAIVVHADPESILAGLVLARDRRSTTNFWVYKQAELMDFFRGPANDIQDNVDILLVGYTLQPVPQEIISSAQLFRGRLQWYDYHDWPPEDLSRLREALGSDSVIHMENAAGPLATVLEVTERRSRFTDKLVDMIGSRLAESDMEKWGYRVAGLVKRMSNKSGDYRVEVGSILSGKPTELPEAESVYENEATWLAQNAPRVVHFGEYQMVVLRVPAQLNAGEVARRSRQQTGARISFVCQDDRGVVQVAANEEKRTVNVNGLVEEVGSQVSWADALQSGDRVAHLRIHDLATHPERVEAVVAEIVRHKSILYG